MKKDYKRFSHLVLPYLKQHIGRLSIVIISLIAVSLSLMSFGYVMSELINAISDGNEVLLYFRYLLAVIILFSIASFTRSYNINYIASNITYQIKSSLFSHLMSLSPDVMEQYSPSQLQFSLTQDIEKIYKLIVDIFSFLLRNSIMLIGSLCLMLLANPKLTLLVFLGIALLLSVVLKLSRKTRYLAQELQAHEVDLSTYIIEALNNFKILFGLDAARAYGEQEQEKSLSLIIDAAHRYKYRALFFASTICGILLLILSVCYIGVQDIAVGNTSSGSMVAFLFYAIMAAFSLGGIIENASDVENCMLATSRIHKIFALESNDSHIPANITINSKSTIKFDKINFAYPQRPESTVLRACSLELPCDGLVAIIGPSGSGKSSVVKLLMGFYEAQSGKLYIDGVEICRSNLFTYCPQEPMLFSMSIQENICLGAEYNEKRFQQVIQITGLDEILSNLPQHQDTILTKGGGDLSGGQRQRVAIARALYKQDAQILILDEATSNLDAQSESKIMRAVEESSVYRGIICITHRVANVKEADHIVVMNKGAVEAEGNHASLLQACTLYQLLSYDGE